MLALVSPAARAASISARLTVTSARDTQTRGGFASGAVGRRFGIDGIFLEFPQADLSTSSLLDQYG